MPGLFILYLLVILSIDKVMAECDANITTKLKPHIVSNAFKHVSKRIVCCTQIDKVLVYDMCLKFLQSTV